MQDVCGLAHLTLSAGACADGCWDRAGAAAGCCCCKGLLLVNPSGPLPTPPHCPRRLTLPAWCQQVNEALVICLSVSAPMPEEKLAVRKGEQGAGLRRPWRLQAPSALPMQCASLPCALPT